jgi:serpin B
MRRSFFAALLVLAACEKTKAVQEPQAATPSSSTALMSAPPPTAPPPTAPPAGSKQGPTPDDPFLANQAPLPMPPLSETRPLATASNAFAFDLFARIGKAPGNTAFSPASISIALAMTWLGANGETSAQMKRTMRFEGTQEATAAGWGNLGRVMSTPPRGMKLRIVNRLFGEKTYAFEPPFLEKTQRHFGAPLEPLDLRTGFVASQRHINQWVEDQTDKRIVELLPPGTLDATTRLVLVNAIYFLAYWSDPFEKAATSDQPFALSASSTKSVPTMHRTGRLGYAQLDGVKVLELPYKGGDASMIVVLPDAQEGLPAVERSLSAARMEGWRRALSTDPVEVALPRFEISPASLPLAGDLQALGMPLAFDRNKADFGGIGKPADPGERLYIAKVFHKAFVKVDEKGTEAAAATAVILAAPGSAAPAKVREFKADHPFLFFVVEKTSGLILFMGRVADPSVK